MPRPHQYARLAWSETTPREVTSQVASARSPRENANTVTVVFDTRAALRDWAEKVAIVMAHPRVDAKYVREHAQTVDIVDAKARPGANRPGARSTTWSSGRTGCPGTSSSSGGGP